MLLGFAGYIVTIWHFGKPMKEFFTGRVNSWTISGLVIFETIMLTNNVQLEFGEKELGGGIKKSVPTESYRKPMTKKTKIIVGIITATLIIGTIWLLHLFNVRLTTYLMAFIWLVIAPIANLRQPMITVVKKGYREPQLLIPRSTYSVNGVDTVLIWDLHPILHPDIEKGITKLNEAGITTLTQLEDVVDDVAKSESELVPGYTYMNWYEMYMATKRKYEVEVKVSDITNFIGQNFDKNFRESIEAKEFNAKTKSRLENKFLKYGYAAIIIIAIGITFKIGYITVYGGKAAVAVATGTGAP